MDRLTKKVIKNILKRVKDSGLSKKQFCQKVGISHTSLNLVLFQKQQITQQIALKIARYVSKEDPTCSPHEFYPYGEINVIRKLRIEHNMTSRELAKRLARCEGFTSDLQSGRARVTDSVATKLSEIFNKPVEAFVGINKSCDMAEPMKRPEFKSVTSFDARVIDATNKKGSVVVPFSAAQREAELRERNTFLFLDSFVARHCLSDYEVKGDVVCFYA